MGLHIHKHIIVPFQSTGAVYLYDFNVAAATRGEQQTGQVAYGATSNSKAVLGMVPKIYQKRPVLPRMCGPRVYYTHDLFIKLL